MSLAYTVNRHIPVKRLLAVVLAGVFFLPPMSLAQPPGLTGQWLFNQKDSDVTDRQVEAALRAMGQKVQRRLFDNRRDRYRGGPPEQELYDRISYDNELSIEIKGDHYLLTYADDWQRTVWFEDKDQTVSLSALDELEDFSFAATEDDVLIIEGRPRDGGFTVERYFLNDEGQLVVDIYAQPGTFIEPVEIERVYDRAADQE